MKHMSLRIRDIMPLLWARLKPHRKVYFTGLILGLSQLLSLMLFPLVSQFYFNMLDAGKYAGVRNLLIVSVIGFLLLNFAALIGMYYKLAGTGKLNRDLMIEMSNEAQRLPLERAQGSHSSDLVQRVSQDIKKTASILTSIVDGIGNAVILFLLAITYMISIQWQVGLALLIISPTVLLASHLLRYRLQKIGRAVSEQEAVVRQCQQDILQGIETVKAFGVGEWMRARFVSERQKLNKLQLKRMWWQQAVSVSTYFITSIIEIGTLFVLGYLVIKSTLALGAVVAVFSLVYRIVGPMNAVGREWGNLQKSLGASMRTFALWRAEKEPFQAVSFDPVTLLTDHHIHFHQVNFRYREKAALGDYDVFGKGENYLREDKEQVRIERFDLHIPSGSFAALVGPSGAGKSTVAKLAAGLLFPQQGKVEIAGMDTTVHAEKARESVAYVPQTPYLFAGTIKDNLLVADDSATDEEIREALELAQAADFIDRFPNGLDTDIKELGNSLSGGQRQRIAIARAILAKRPVVILDEATSALDFQTERIVMDHIRRRAAEHGQTLLVIAHRLSTIIEADEIIVMHDGKIAQRGNHEQLLQDESGLYDQLWGQMKSSEG